MICYKSQMEEKIVRNERSIKDGKKTHDEIEEI